MNFVLIVIVKDYVVSQNLCVNKTGCKFEFSVSAAGVYSGYLLLNS